MLSKALGKLREILVQNDEKYGRDDQQDAFELLGTLLGILEDDYAATSDNTDVKGVENEAELSDLPEDLVKPMMPNLII